MLNTTTTRPTVRPFTSFDPRAPRSRTWGIGRLVAIATQRLERREQTTREQRIVASFAEWHPEWHASLFDATFLASPAARAAIEARDPAALAAAWTEQFRYADEDKRRRDARRATAVAGDFLAIVEGELPN